MSKFEISLSKDDLNISLTVMTSKSKSTVKDFWKQMKSF